MKYQEVIDAIEALHTLTKETEVVIIGSQSLHGVHPDEPDEIKMSQDVDLMMRTRAKLGYWLSEVVGEQTPFHYDRGYYIDHVVPTENLPILAKGWEDRATEKRYVSDKVKVVFISPEDLAISKLGAGRDKDFHFVSKMLERKLINTIKLKSIIERFGFDDPNHAAKVNATLARLSGEMKGVDRGGLKEYRQND